MKKTGILAIIMACSMGAAAQTLAIHSGNVTYLVDAATAGQISCNNASSVTFMGKTLNVSDISQMTVTSDAVTPATVTVTYAGNSASATVSGDIAAYVDLAFDGAHVTVTQSAEVSDITCGEITYVLSGTSTDGAFALSGSYKSTIRLAGLDLTNAGGAALDIQNGKRIALRIASGTANRLEDCAGGAQKGCITCKGHLEFQDDGTLTVAGHTGHAIHVKEYVEIKNSNIIVTSAVKDGINCNQYFTMESGKVDISGTGDDGIQVSFKDDVDREPEDTGTADITGGEIKIKVTAEAAKGLKADGDINISGGSFDITTTGNGRWDETDVKTKASAAIGADGKIRIDGGTFLLDSSGSGGKGINGDSDVIINDGVIEIHTTGGLMVYSNGSLNHNYTGNTDNIDSDYKSSPKGIKGDGNIDINGGDIRITTTGHGGEGIESKAVLTISGGTIDINAYDDGTNSSSHTYIKGGDLTVCSSTCDGIDSNGSIFISGGTVRTFGARAPEEGLDAGTENGYVVEFTGGTVLAVGGKNCTPTTDASTQAYVTANSSVTAGQTVTLKSGDTVLAQFTVPATYSPQGGSQPWGAPGGPGGGPGGGGGGLLITCPGLVSGQSYTLVAGTTSTTVTAALKGTGGGRPF